MDSEALWRADQPFTGAHGVCVCVCVYVCVCRVTARGAVVVVCPVALGRGVRAQNASAFRCLPDSNFAAPPGSGWFQVRYCIHITLTLHWHYVYIPFMIDLDVTRTRGSGWTEVRVDSRVMSHEHDDMRGA